MTTTKMTKHEPDSTAVARPLAVLVPLIQQDIENGKQAEQLAGMPFYKAAGEKLIEAKSQVPHGEWQAWIKRNLKVTSRAARNWMDFARKTQNGSELPFSSMSQATSPPRAIKGDRSEPVAQEVRNIERNIDRHHQQQLAEREERELALKMIDLGYKALAAKFHPDKGGSSEQMHKLQNAKKKAQSRIDPERAVKN